MNEAIIKQIPKDFIVRERSEPVLDSGGRFSYYRLWKKGYSTQKAIEVISRVFHKKLKYINFAGNKDKYAVTEQYISILHGPQRNFEKEDLRLEFLGRGRERINLGDLEGNDFEIIVRNIQEVPKIPACYPNYYDTQRFGMNMDNHEIGKLIIQKRYEEACSKIPELSLKLNENPNDYIGALRSLPKRVLRLYPHSYQAFLWNRIVSEYLGGFDNREINYPLGSLVIPRMELNNIDISLPGYEMGKPENKKLRNIIRSILKEENILAGDFMQKSFPEFDLKGGVRSLLMDVKNINIENPEVDELNSGKKKIKISFRLGPGSYATMVLRIMFGLIRIPS